MNYYERKTEEERRELNRRAHQKWYYSKTPEERSAISKKKRERRKELHGSSYNRYPEWEARAWPRPLCTSHLGNVKKKYPGAIVEEFDLDTFIAWVQENYHTTCKYCGSEGHHIDHIVPLSKGGLHTKDNLQMLCAPCNRGKGDMLPEEWDEHVRKIALKGGLS